MSSQQVISGGNIFVCLVFFDGTRELQLIPLLNGARPGGLSFQIAGLLESAFTHTQSLAGLVKTLQHLLLLEAYEFTSRLQASLEIT